MRLRLNRPARDDEREMFESLGHGVLAVAVFFRFVRLFVVRGEQGSNVFLDFAGLQRWTLAVLQVKQDVDGLDAPANLDRLAVDNGRQRGEALLAVEQQFAAGKGPGLLDDGGVAGGHRFVSLPHENRAAGVAAIKRVEQVAHAGGAPDIVSLDFRQPQLPAFIHVNE